MNRLCGTAHALAVLALCTVMAGCKERPDILSQEPVIPLVGHTDEEGVGTESTYPSLHVSGQTKEDTVSGPEAGNTGGLKDDASGTGEAETVSSDSKAGGEDDRKEASAEGEGYSYELEGTQLGEEQLVKMSAYFNLSSVNPYLQQEYDIPQDFDENKESEEVYITCIAGSYDSNRLYSIFYKKDNDDGLWNAVLRSSDGDYRFHSNRRCAD